VSGDVEAEEPTRPLLRIVRGEPTPEELAALVAVLSARSGGSEPAPEPAPSAWGRPGSGVRGALPTYAGAWRESGFTQGVRTRADW
jgi:hypothetical protein